MNEVAAFSIVAIPLFCKGMTTFCLVGSIMFHVHTKFLRTVRELTFFSIRAVPFFSKILAERGLGLGACIPEGGFGGKVGAILLDEVVFITLGGGLALEIE